VRRQSLAMRYLFGGTAENSDITVVIMSYARRVLLVCSVVLLATSCAVASQSGDGNSRSQTRLSHADLENTSELTLYDAIQRLRPRWLRPRGTNSARGPARIVVYLNNVRVGGVSYLHDLAVESVQEVSFINASDATTRWGIGVAGGVILVISRSG